MPRMTVRSLRAAALPLVLALALAGGARAAQATEIVPSIGISQAADGEDRQTMVAIALRTGLVPRVKAELQVGHRSEELQFVGETLELRTVPVTLSLWVSPVPMLYAGGGVGAYFQGVEYRNNLFPASDDTQFGAHLGGGMRFSMTPMVGLDLQGRYVFLGEQSTRLSSGDFDPSFWTLSAGVAIGF